jgi:hypothetical protein
LVSKQAAHLLEVGLQGIFLGALFLKVSLLLQVSPGRSPIRNAYCPTYEANYPGRD